MNSHQNTQERKSDQSSLFILLKKSWNLPLFNVRKSQYFIFSCNVSNFLRSLCNAIPARSKVTFRVTRRAVVCKFRTAHPFLVTYGGLWSDNTASNEGYWCSKMYATSKHGAKHSKQSNLFRHVLFDKWLASFLFDKGEIHSQLFHKRVLDTRLDMRW